MGKNAREDEGGTSTVEYALLIAGIAAVIVVVVVALGGGVSSLFSNSCSTIASQITKSARC